MRTSCALLTCVIFALTIAPLAATQETTPAADQAPLILRRQLVSAGIASDEAERLVRAMAAHGFNRGQLMNFGEVVETALENECPLGPITAKAMEGIAKRAAPQNILRAVRNVQQRYFEARRQAAKISTDPHLRDRHAELIAAAVAARLQTGEMASIVDLLGRYTVNKPQPWSRRMATESLVATRDLARLGISSHDVGDLIKSAIAQGFEPRDMSAMRSAFLTASTGDNLGQLARGLAQQIRNGQGAQAIGEIGKGPSHQTRSRSGKAGPAGSGGAGGSSGGGSGGSGGSGGGGKGGGDGNGGGRL